MDSEDRAKSGGVGRRKTRKYWENKPFEKGPDWGATYGQKTRKALENQGFCGVARAGIEPATHGFSIRCSTN